MYLDSENWLKGSIEYENEQFQHLGSVATNMGYSDWATTEIDSSFKATFTDMEVTDCQWLAHDGRAPDEP